MKNKTKYLVLSLRNLRDMLAVAEQVVRTGPHSDIGQSSCVIYGVEEVSSDGQLSIESVRAVSSKTHYDPTVCSFDLLPYRGTFLTNPGEPENTPI